MSKIHIIAERLFVIISDDGDPLCLVSKSLGEYIVLFTTYEKAKEYWDQQPNLVNGNIRVILDPVGFFKYIKEQEAGVRFAVDPFRKDKDNPLSVAFDEVSETYTMPTPRAIGDA